MNPQDFSDPRTGDLVPISGIRGADYAFVPTPLPPDWQWPDSMWSLLMEARESLALLRGISVNLPSPEILVRSIIQREAVQSSSLEGTFTPPVQQALFELEPNALEVEDRTLSSFREISNYGAALRFYFYTPNQLPISLRLIRRLHEILMTGVRGADKDPGEFRRVQVHIGNPPQFVPPPLDRLSDCLSQLERYIHADHKFNQLVEAFLVHYQFETIHPFRDGNGRVGRLLLSIMISEAAQMADPWMHMSAYFDANRDEYVRHLKQVSTKGAWQPWIEFCLRGVVVQANDTVDRCRRLLNLRNEYLESPHIADSARLTRIVQGLFSNPVVTAPYLMSTLEIAGPTARSDISKLVDAGVLAEVKGQSRPRAYFAQKILDVIYD